MEPKHKLFRDDACALCRFFDAGINVCRRSPPVQLPREFAEGEYGLTAYGAPAAPVRSCDITWGWPKVSPRDWCGEWMEED